MSPFQPWAHGLNEIRLPAGGEDFTRVVLGELIENVPLALAVALVPTRQFVFANRLFERAFAGQVGSLIGQTLAQIAGTSDLQALQDTVLATGSAREVNAFALVTGSATTYWDIKLLPILETQEQVVGVLILGANATERVKAQSEADRQSREAALFNERLALAVEATELGLWEWSVETGETFWSDRQKDLFGLPRAQSASYEFWVQALHPDDRERVLTSVMALLDPRSGGQLQLEHRVVLPDGEVRWISSRGRMLYEIIDGALKPVRLLGTVLDITARRQEEEVRQLLVQELNHRVKNLFALTSGMISLTARTAASPRQMAEALRGRLDALSRAHELIRPALPGSGGLEETTSLDRIVQSVLAPHVHEGSAQRAAISGEPAIVGAKAATALTLVLHELATNASKYGCLSVPEGRLSVRWQAQGDHLILDWREESGPAVAGTPSTEGFGSQLALRSIKGQLGGDIAYDWQPGGLQVRIVVPSDQLAQTAP